VVFHVSLHVVHHGYGSDERDGGNYLVQVKTRMKDPPGDTHGSERLHHFEVAGG
jgi:hypothetical protein